MIDQKKASQLARAGFDLWQEGKLEESVAKYREVLGCADPNHYGLDGYHVEFAAVLATLGRYAEAREQYDRALAQALRQDADANSPGVLIVRYFLGEHLLRMSEPAQALAIVHGHGRASKQDSALRTVEAKALWELGRRDESRAVAAAAVDLAATEQQRENIREDLRFILDASG